MVLDSCIPFLRKECKAHKKDSLKPEIDFMKQNEVTDNSNMGVLHSKPPLYMPNYINIYLEKH